MQIITNHHWRQFVYRSDVPNAVLADDFDWTNADDHTDGFFRYRGSWYHTDDFMRVEPNGEFAEAGWHGRADETAFSCLVVRLSDDGESYQIATVLA